MKRAKYIISLIFCFCIGYIIAIYTYPTFLKTRPPIPMPTLNQNSSQKTEYIVDIPAKYFDPDKVYDETQAPIPGNIFILGGNLEITKPPVAIDCPTNIEVVDEEFKFGHLPITKIPFMSDFEADIDNDGEVESNLAYGDQLIDVDNDGKKEQILYSSVGGTHQPHKVIIIKKGRVIYKSEDLLSIFLLESKSHNGFYLANIFDIGAFPITGGHKLTRFIFENGKFIPVWYRESFDLQTTKQ